MSNNVVLLQIKIIVKWVQYIYMCVQIYYFKLNISDDSNFSYYKKKKKSFYPLCIKKSQHNYLIEFFI